MKSKMTPGLAEPIYISKHLFAFIVAMWLQATLNPLSKTAQALASQFS
jgi:hypothetical protein